MTGKVRAVLLTALAASLALAGPAAALHGATDTLRTSSTAGVADGPSDPAAAEPGGSDGPVDTRGDRSATVTVRGAPSGRCLQHRTDDGTVLVTDGDLHPVDTPAGPIRPPIAGAHTETSPGVVGASTAGEDARIRPPELPPVPWPFCRTLTKTLSAVAVRVWVSPLCTDAPMDRSRLCVVYRDATIWVNWSAGGGLDRLQGDPAAGARADPDRSTGARPDRTRSPDGSRSGPRSGAETSSADPRAQMPGSDGADAWLGAAVGVTVGALALVWLYRRLTDADILDHDLRSKILELADAEPGIHVAALAERLDVAPRTAHYHVRILEEAGHVLVKERGGQRMILAAEAGSDRLAREAICALRQDGKRELLRTLAAEPGLSLTEIARRIDRHPSTVKRHADDLVERGLVDAVRDGAARRLRLVEAAAPHVRDRA